jgi:hypothetical protein
MGKKYLSPHQREVLDALERLGGVATTSQIATEVGRSVNGVLRSLNALLNPPAYVCDIDGWNRGDTKWQLLRTYPKQQRMKLD